MKKYILTSLVLLAGITTTLAQENGQDIQTLLDRYGGVVKNQQAELETKTEQLYTIQLVNSGTNLGSDFVGFLDTRYNRACGACEPTDANCPTIGGQVCAVMKAPANSTEVMYKIVQARHGTLIPNFKAWMADNSTCGLPADTTVAGRPGCAIVLANPFESTTEENDSF